jgi:hypothetical protein
MAFFRPLSPLALIRNQQVAGSIPAGGSIVSIAYVPLLGVPNTSPPRGAQNRKRRLVSAVGPRVSRWKQSAKRDGPFPVSGHPVGFANCKDSRIRRARSLAQSFQQV